MPNYDFDQAISRGKSWKWDNESMVDGHPVLPMTVADTDFVSPREVTAALRGIVDGEEFGYPCYPADHREVFSAWQTRQHAWELDPADVIIADGLLSSLASMIEAVSAPGDGIVLFTPVYHCFFDVISGIGRTALSCDLVADEQSQWNVDMAAYEQLCERAETRAVVICNPHNPVGRAWQVSELRTIISIAQQHDVIVFSDEIHADFVYDQPFNPALKAARNTQGIMTLTSGGKIFNIGGLFVSYAISEDEQLKSVLQKSLDQRHWHSSIFSEWGSYTAYKYGYSYRDEVVAYIRRMQIKLVEALNGMPLPLKARLPEATYLLWADFRNCGWSQDEIQRFLVEDAGLGFSRGDAFGRSGTGFVRINCAVPESRMDAAILRLRSACQSRAPKCG